MRGETNHTVPLDIKDLSTTNPKPEFNIKQPEGRFMTSGVDETTKTINTDSAFKAAVGLSRKWDAREAGREVAIDTLNKLGHGVKPDFFLLFSTIHYEKHGGFKEFLKGIWEILPEGTPLIGGTVAGFINPQGCYTRGATAMAVNYPNMDVATGIGHHARRFPKKAGITCASMIVDKITSSKYDNRFLISFMPGPSMPHFPGMKDRIIIERNPVIVALTDILMYLSTMLLNRGVGREEEILSGIDTVSSGYYLLGGSCADDNHYFDNYQFYANKVYDNSVVCMGVSIDSKIILNHSESVSPPTELCTITKQSSWGHILKEIDGKPALSKYLEILGWSEDDLKEPKKIHRKFVFKPFVSVDENGDIYPYVPGSFIGNNIALGCRLRLNKIGVSFTDGKRMISTIEKAMGGLNNNKKIFFGVSCSAILEALGSSIYAMQDTITKTGIIAPYLLLYLGGEEHKYPNKLSKLQEMTTTAIQLE